MAFEAPLFMVPGQVAAADLSAKQYYCVKKNTTDNQVALCSVDGEIFLGVLQNKPTSGIAASVMAAGVTKVLAAETLTAGDYWGTDNAGKARIVEKTNTGADIGDYAAGVVLQGAGAGELASVTVGLMSFIVESA
jgi:hypothetical protein